MFSVQVKLKQYVNWQALIWNSSGLIHFLKMNADTFMTGQTHIIQLRPERAITK